MHSRKKSDIDSTIRFALNILHTHETIIAPLGHQKVQNGNSYIEFLDREFSRPKNRSKNQEFFSRGSLRFALKNFNTYNFHKGTAKTYSDLTVS